MSPSKMLARHAVERAMSGVALLGVTASLMLLEAITGLLGRGSAPVVAAMLTVGFGLAALALLRLLSALSEPPPAASAKPIDFDTTGRR